MLKRIPSCSSNQSPPALPHSARSFNPGLILPSRSWPYGSSLQSSNTSVRDLSGGRPRITANENLGQEFQPRRGNLRRGTLGTIVPGVFTPVLAKHSKSFSLLDSISVGVDRMQRNFEPMRKQVEAWRQSELTDVTAKIIIYQAFIEGELDVPKHLARRVHDLYFEPAFEEFKPRTVWSLSNAFTSAFKELDPIPQFKATAKLGSFLEGRFKASF
jgi:hypothetical protein